jgi:putative hydrolase of the HAD superfamily
MTRQPLSATGFDRVEAWVFDLDNTLYPADCNLFAQVDERMNDFISELLEVPVERAQEIRRSYYYDYGTTLAGLIREHKVCPHRFLEHVHDIDLTPIDPCPDLVSAIEALPGRKLIFTNGSRRHAEAVAGRLGVLHCFEEIFDIQASDFVPKPDPSVYELFIGTHGVAAANAAMFDDLPPNLAPAHALGMTTVLVGHGATEHPEHQAISGWTELPAHVHHRTDALPRFLDDIAKALALPAGRGRAESLSLT